MEYKDEIFTVLKMHHLRLTTIREVLVGLFFKKEIPLSAQDILRELRKGRKSVNKTTVYRELNQLQKKGIIGLVQLGSRKRHYELAAREHHHHLVCLRCEYVEDVDMDETKLFVEEKKISGEKKFTVLRHSLEFFGFCGKCQPL